MKKKETPKPKKEQKERKQNILPAPKDPYQIDVKISFREFFNGCTKRVASKVGASMTINIIKISAMDRELIKKIGDKKFVIRVQSANWDIQNVDKMKQTDRVPNLVYYYTQNDTQTKSITLPSGKVIVLNKLPGDIPLEGSYGPKGERMVISFEKIEMKPNMWNIERYVDNQLIKPYPQVLSKPIREERVDMNINRNRNASPRQREEINMNINRNQPQQHQPRTYNQPPQNVVKFETFGGTQRTESGLFYYLLRHPQFHEIQAKIIVVPENKCQHYDLSEPQFKESQQTYVFYVKWITNVYNQYTYYQFRNSHYPTEIDERQILRTENCVPTEYCVNTDVGNIPFIIPIPQTNQDFYVFENHCRPDGKIDYIVFEMVYSYH